MAPPHEHHRWAWRIGSIAGIPVYIHATFVLLLAWVGFMHLGAPHQAALVLQGLLLVICVFAIVVLHELGHALVAAHFGVPTRDITLYPIGGISHIERMPEAPRQELLVALAGPAVNVVLAVLIFFALEISGTGAGGDPLTLGAAFAVQLMWINIVLGFFNLLPALPMDGGRILRAILAHRLPRVRATVTAAHVARGIAVMMGVIGVLSNPWLAVIAVFVWLAAGQEARAEEIKATLHGLAVENAMATRIETIAPAMPLGVAAQGMMSGFQHDFPVVHDGHVIGVLTHDDVVRGLAMHRPELTVADVMHAHFAVADAHAELASVVSRLAAEPVVVVEHDQLVGLLDPEHVSRLLATRV